MNTMKVNPRGACKFFTLLALVLGGCTKDEVSNTRGTPVQGVPKIERFFLASASGTGSFSVRKWNATCVDGWGTVNTNPRAHANDGDLLNGAPSYVRVDNGSCIIDGSWLRLQRGNNAGTNNTWGPWYYIWPNFGPAVSVRKGIKIRVKKLSPLLGNDYNGDITYDGAANTWNTAFALTLGTYEIVEVVGTPTDLCPPK